MKKLRCVASSMAIMMITLACPVRAEPTALEKGIQLEAFIKGFNSHAKFDGEPLVELRDCQSRPTSDRKAKAWTCRMGFEAFADGVTRSDGTVRDASITAAPHTRDDFERMRRAYRYLVRSARGGLPLGDGLDVMDALAAAAKAPGQIRTIERGGLKISAVKNSEDQWTMSVEPLAAGR